MTIVLSAVIGCGSRNVETRQIRSETALSLPRRLEGGILLLRGAEVDPGRPGACIDDRWIELVGGTRALVLVSEKEQRVDDLASVRSAIASAVARTGSPNTRVDVVDLGGENWLRIEMPGVVAPEHLVEALINEAMAGLRPVGVERWVYQAVDTTEATEQLRAAADAMVETDNGRRCFDWAD